MSAARRVTILCLALLLMPANATAQGFLESLFGFGDGGPQSHRGSSRNAPSDYGYREPVTRSSSPYVQDEAPSRHDGKYRTLCVRSCDGFYFPISGSATRRDFYRDAEICRQSCGVEAKLYYHPRSSGDASKMVDLAGFPYTQHPNAFRYRKQLVDKCACRPDPWSASEIARHKRYAAAEATEIRAGSREAGTERPDGPGAKPPLETEGALASESQATVPIDRPVDTKQPAEVDTIAPVIRRADVRPLPARTSAEAPIARGRPKTRPAPSQPFNLFGFAFGGNNQKKLRWPGD
jgi:hypothetical protein